MNLFSALSKQHYILWNHLFIGGEHTNSCFFGLAVGKVFSFSGVFKDLLKCISKSNSSLI